MWYNICSSRFFVECINLFTLKMEMEREINKFKNTSRLSILEWLITIGNDRVYAICTC